MSFEFKNRKKYSNTEYNKMCLRDLPKTDLIALLCELNEEDVLSQECGSKAYCKTKIKVFYEKFHKSIEHIRNIEEHDSEEWKFLCVNFVLLECLMKSLSENDIFSVQETRKLKSVFSNLINMGILCNLVKSLPLHKSIGNNDLDQTSFSLQLVQYRTLRMTTKNLIDYLKCSQLRYILIPEFLNSILVGLYQIVYCPLKKPSIPCNNEFMMTEDMFQQFLHDREIFKGLLVYLTESIYKPIYVRETMVLMHAKAPPWFKLAISRNLTDILLSDKGIESIALAMFDDTTNDSTRTWNALDSISNIVLSSKSTPDFHEKVCPQLFGLLNAPGRTANIYEQIFITCIKKFYWKDKTLCEKLFLDYLKARLLNIVRKKNIVEDQETITDHLQQSVRLLHSCFGAFNVNISPLPIKILRPLMVVIFRLYMSISEPSFLTLNNELKVLLKKYFQHEDETEAFAAMDAILFNINPNNIPDVQEVLIICECDKLITKKLDRPVAYAVDECCEKLHNIFKSSSDLECRLFRYLLNCLVKWDEYFMNNSDEQLLSCEDDYVIPKSMKTNLAVFNLIANLTDSVEVQQYVNEAPESIIRYIHTVFKRALNSNLHQSTAYESDAFQTLFTIAMILHALIEGCAKERLTNYDILLAPLENMHRNCSNAELKDLLQRTILILKKGAPSSRNHGNITEVDKAVEDVCDPLLPIRGHGLLTLTKLVERKNESAMARKQYIFNIFRQNLKHEDSYIYLSAVGGLAAMGDVLTDNVLEVLAEEYVDFSRKDTSDGHEIRMKLGEVLMRVTKVLGDMAPKYKTLLLNAFLAGTKDDDHLIRASSLSNLGEVCRVLGYKLGSIVNEVLVCVNAIIETDKSIEPRRAAVTVFRQLLHGLEAETIVFLKDDILPIYRTLKSIYHNDKDDIMRLQAQLALEELNENMKNFVFPKLHLNDEKKVIIFK